MIELLYTSTVQAVIFAIPCWIVNMSFNLLNPLKRKFEIINRINFPIDFGIVLKDKQRLLGGSQGFLSFVLITTIPFLLTLFTNLQHTYLKAFCTFLGDALGSFIKRRLRLPQGQFLVGIDHADYMLMTCFVFLTLGKVELSVACIALILTYIFHPLVCILGFKLGIKTEKF